MIKPLGARALVLRLPEPKPESSLLITPETVEDKPSKFAVVLAIGTLQQGGFDVGDTVILQDYVGAPCTTEIDGATVEAAIVTEDQVLAVMGE